jgi:hypothetical protein
MVEENSMSSYAATDCAPAAPAVAGAVAAPSPGAIFRAPFDPGSSAQFRAPSLTSLAEKLMHEIRETGRANWRQPFRLASYFKAWQRRRASGRAFSHAQLALGRSMYAAGIDDGESRVRMHSLDDENHGTEAATPSGKALYVQRAKLLIRLAASALAEEAPLPGADAEYRGARAAQAALRTHDAELAAAKALLMPPGKLDWCRVAVGYGTISCFLFLAVLLVWILA